MQHTPTPPLAEDRRFHAGTPSAASLLHESDERLVSLARSGSERAWTEIMRRYGRQLRAYCARFVGPSRAEDAVQQTFLQAFLALRDGSQREIALRAWLYRIAHNCAIDVLRKGSPDHEQLDLEHDGVAQPPMVFEQKEEIRGLVARMRELPPAQRQALALRELEGRSYEEISQQLGHSGSGVRQLIFRARTTLRNGAAAILPFGLLRARLSQPVGIESHQIATAAAVSGPASSGGGLDAIGAATLAVVAVLGGGLSAADSRARHDHATQGSQAQVAAPASPAYGVAPVGTPASVVSAPTQRSQAARPTRPAANTLDTQLHNVGVPATAPAPPAAPPAGPPLAPGTDQASAAPPALAAPAGEAPGVRQQTTGSGPSGTTPAKAGAPRGTTGASGPTGPAARAPGQPVNGTNPSGQGPSGSKPSGPVAPGKPVKPQPVKQPVKPQPVKPQPSKGRAPKTQQAKPKATKAAPATTSGSA